MSSQPSQQPHSGLVFASLLILAWGVYRGLNYQDFLKFDFDFDVFALDFASVGLWSLIWFDIMVNRFFLPPHKDEHHGFFASLYLFAFSMLCIGCIGLTLGIFLISDSFILYLYYFFFLLFVMKFLMKWIKQRYRKFIFLILLAVLLCVYLFIGRDDFYMFYLCDENGIIKDYWSGSYLLYETTHIITRTLEITNILLALFLVAFKISKIWQKIQS